eukprot:TRINITY_DN1114_c0_g1_i5.p1 TRINITY_DN1114_c0_g1~~TRINITY_DN1114_c0_g1_i5.p1  ORF type:complete len:159 (-),score=1.79 TRINITY_DN1114_c0_g1_i5:192-668(-)
MEPRNSDFPSSLSSKFISNDVLDTILFPVLTSSARLPPPDFISDNWHSQYLQLLAALVRTPPTEINSQFNFFIDYQAKDKSFSADFDIGTREAEKIVKKVTRCPHKDRKHYAKNLCSNCYRKQGRIKRAWACAHTGRSHYAKGMCQMCYLSGYHKVVL